MADYNRPAFKIHTPEFEDEQGDVPYVMPLNQRLMLSQEVYSSNEVAQLLHISLKRVYRYASRPRDPLPLRKWPNGGSESFVLRDEFIEWLRNNTLPIRDSQKTNVSCEIESYRFDLDTLALVVNVVMCFCTIVQFAFSIL